MSVSVGVGLFGCVRIYVGVGRCVFVCFFLAIIFVVFALGEQKKEAIGRKIAYEEGFCVSVCMH